MQADANIGADFVQRTLTELRRELGVRARAFLEPFCPWLLAHFAGGYAAGYYSYLWAEVLAADAYSAFEETGVFNRATGKRFMNTILGQGGSREALELFVEFRGREPILDPFLRLNGIAA